MYLASKFYPWQNRVTIVPELIISSQSWHTAKRALIFCGMMFAVFHMDRWKRVGWKDETEHSSTAQGLELDI